MKKCLFALVAGLATLGAVSGPAPAADRPTAPANASYSVYYYNVKTPNKVHRYGTYSSYASALRAMHYVNSLPEYRAYLRTNRSHG